MTYNITQIAQELDDTANGLAYYGNSLYVSMDFPCITVNDKLCLSRWLHGTNNNQDRFRLQDIAITIREWGKENCIHKIIEEMK